MGRRSASGRMDQYEFIRTGYRVYGKSISELSRTTGHSRNTMKKAIREEPWGYKARRHQGFPVLGPYMGVVDRWLKGDRKEPKKQPPAQKEVIGEQPAG